MILTEIDDTTKTGKIILRPNHSWSWRANVLLLSTLMGISMTIGVGFLVAGAWVILPYSLAEMTVVALCLHYCVKQCARQEVITVSDHEVRIERGIRRPSREEKFHRLWARFFLISPKHPWDAPALSIRSHGVESEIGSFLNRRDKYNLVEQLKRVIPN